MISVHVRIQGRVLSFTSHAARDKFLELAEGKECLITIDDSPSANMRRFFEGAVVPSVFYQNPFSGWENFKDAREALKLEFCAGYTKGLDGETVKYARSTTELSKGRFTQLLESVIRWMEENGMEIPDPEDYKLWRDSAPSPGQIYPPLLRLKERYNDEHARRSTPKPTKSRKRKNRKRTRHAKKSPHRKSR